MVVGMLPENSFFDRSNRTRALNLPISYGSSPTRALDDKFTSKTSLRFQKEDVSKVALNKPFGMLPTSLFPVKCSCTKFGRVYPISDGKTPERELYERYKYFNVEMLKIFDGIGPLKSLNPTARCSNLPRFSISMGIGPS
ncbi:hypothetical protein Ahy_B10g100611 isoform C [Arachis hypogaea]|uniref:Uncharacterized protein n=1 Tax=Arachis hypogaea TaxID=3818 RepID=A0A444WXC4_ARAHY|nr:hypothetical protein Ahy_B10g100611 isoform C [Arachis hypogaea]